MLRGETEKPHVGLVPESIPDFAVVWWCGGDVMSTRQKHRALNGITQGDVNLGRAGGELNMIRELQ